MQKIDFQNYPDTTTPIDADNLNDLQDNVEEAIDEVQDNLDVANTYSNNEIVIGKWVDNRPVYRKVIYISSFPNATTENYVTGTSNIDFFIKVYGYAGDLIINGARPESLEASIGAWQSGDNLRISSGNRDRSNYSGHVVIEYTKTTD